MAYYDAPDTHVYKQPPVAAWGGGVQPNTNDHSGSGSWGSGSVGVTQQQGNGVSQSGSAINGPAPIDFSKFFSATGTSSGTGTGPGSAAPGLDLTNVAQKDPRLEFLANQVQNRIEHPEYGTKRAIDAAGAGLRDLQTGQEKELGYRSAEGGGLSSGAQEAGVEQLASNTTGKIAGAARDISMQRERDQDQFLLNSQGALSGPGAAARADREMALRQWIEGNADRRANESAELARFSAIANLLGSLGG